MMGSMSFSETIFLFFLALIIFGPKKLPEIARQVGRALNEFRRASNEFKAQIEQEIAHLERENAQTILPPSYPPAGATSRSQGTAPLELPEPEPSATLAAPAEAAAEEANAESGVRATEAVPAENPVPATTSQESHA
jgi:TatA/E family protein of Tat protein translocase